MSVDGKMTQDPSGRPPAKISIKGILEDLKNGLNRTDIQAKYNLNAGELKYLFSQPELANKRAKKKAKAPRFEIVREGDENTEDKNTEEVVTGTTTDTTEDEIQQDTDSRREETETTDDVASKTTEEINS